MGFRTLRHYPANLRKLNQPFPTDFSTTVSTKVSSSCSCSAIMTHLLRVGRNLCVGDEFLPSSFASPTLGEGRWKCVIVADTSEYRSPELLCNPLGNWCYRATPRRIRFRKLNRKFCHQSSIAVL